MGKSSTRCPNCNKPILLSTVDDLPGGNWRKSPKTEFHSMAGNAPTFGEFSEYEKRVPIGRLVPMDVTTNLFHGAVVGTLVIVNLSLGSVVSYLFYWYDYWPWACLVPMTGLVSMTFTYFNGMGLAKNLLEQVESVFRDDDKPAEPEPTKAEPVTLDITHRSESGKVEKRTRPTLPDGVTPELFGQWCDAVCSGIHGLSESEWVGKNKPFTKTPYRQLIAMLAENGVIAKDGTAKNSKWVITRAGSRALPYWAEQLKDTTHSRQADRQTNNYEHIEGAI